MGVVVCALTQTRSRSQMRPAARAPFPHFASAVGPHRAFVGHSWRPGMRCATESILLLCWAHDWARGCLTLRAHRTPARSPRAPAPGFAVLHGCPPPPWLTSCHLTYEPCSPASFPGWYEPAGSCPAVGHSGGLWPRGWEPRHSSRASLHVSSACRHSSAWGGVSSRWREAGQDSVSVVALPRVKSSRGCSLAV